MSVDELGSNMSELQDQVQLGGGAQFWAYVSPQNETSSRVTQWEVQIEQTEGNWIGTITSDNPQEILQTPDLSGIFAVRVTASGPEFGPTVLEPLPDSKPDVGCNSNCAAMVGIVASATGVGANYWTVWDAFCSRD